MNRAIYTVVTILALSNCKGIYAQTNYFDQYNKKLAELRFEKIYIHTDRNNYSVKEDIWFKIYLLDGKNHIPIAGGSNVYVDLVNSRGEIFIHKPFFIENGTGNGNFTIGDTLETGVYTIYAYTSFLRNFGIKSFFRKEITISQILLNADKQVVIGETQSTGKQGILQPGISLQFMPEGGYLSNNMQNTLAFKIAAVNGKGINLKGAIKDQRGLFIDSLQSTHLGMGKINFMPQSDKKYYAVLDYFPSDTFPLPPSYNKPLLQYISITDSIVQFRLCDLSTYNNEKLYYFAVKAKGELSFYLEKRLNKAMSTIKIRIDNFQPGLNQAILLDSNFMPLAERLFFIPGTPQAIMNIQIAKETFKTREKTEVRLEILNKEDASIGGSFSMAAINLDQIGTNGIHLDNIISFLELTSEIRGYIEDPGYYFSEPYSLIKEKLDLLLLTQGWTKYIWDEKFVDSLPEFKYKKETGLTIAGHAQKLLLNRALEEGNISLLVPKEYIILETTTDSTGYFHFDNLVLFDSTKIAVQSRNKNNRKNTRLIDANYIITSPPIFPEPETLNISNTDLEVYIKNAYNRFVSNSIYNFDKTSIILDEVVILGKKKNEDDGHYRLYSQANNVIDMDDYPNMSFSDLFMFLQGSVPGLYIFGDRISIRGAAGPPLILLDGSEIDIMMARSISMFDVDKIEVLKDASATVFGMRGGNGVIAIYTKQGENAYYEYPLFDIIAKSVEGFAKAKEFYVPDYENPETDLAIKDHRATVFWAPNLTPDSAGTCTVSFFNSDDAGKIAIISEGVLSNGKPGVAKAFYWVK